jgi:hypothetical protein
VKTHQVNHTGEGVNRIGRAMAQSGAGTDPARQIIGVQATCQSVFCNWKMVRPGSGGDAWFDEGFSHEVRLKFGGGRRHHASVEQVITHHYACRRGLFFFFFSLARLVCARFSTASGMSIMICSW